MNNNLISMLRLRFILFLSPPPRHSFLILSRFSIFFCLLLLFILFRFSIFFCLLLLFILSGFSISFFSFFVLVSLFFPSPSPPYSVWFLYLFSLVLLLSLSSFSVFLLFVRLSIFSISLPSLFCLVSLLYFLSLSFLFRCIFFVCVCFLASKKKRFYNYHFLFTC